MTAERMVVNPDLLARLRRGCVTASPRPLACVRWLLAGRDGYAANARYRAKAGAR